MVDSLGLLLWVIPWKRRTSELFPFGAQGSFEELPGPSPNLSAQGYPSLFCRLEGQESSPTAVGTGLDPS